MGLQIDLLLGVIREITVWSYKEQMQILSTGCSLKFEGFLLLVFLTLRTFDTRSVRFSKEMLKK